MEILNGLITLDHLMIKFDVDSQVTETESIRGKSHYRRANYKNMKLTLSLTNWNIFFVSCGNDDDKDETSVRLN